MTDPSESAEMYVLTTAALAEAGTPGPVPVPLLADELGITQVSVNQMCRKLEEQGLVRYRPYRGVTLTEAGQALARGVVRRRRLWEVFLVERLGLTIRQAEEVACSLEHAASDAVVDRLAAFLGQPDTCPHGKAIPSVGTLTRASSRRSPAPRVHAAPGADARGEGRA